MKKFLIAFLIMLIAGNCFAASIDVEQAVPAGTVWSFSANLPNGTDFDDARVLLDGSELVSFYTNPSDKIVSYDEDDSRLFSITDPEDGKVYFLVSPMNEGDHDIRLEVDGSTEEEEEIDFFEIYDAESSTSLKEQIDNLKNSVTGLIGQYNQLEEKMGAALTEEDKQQLQSGINNVQSSVSELEASLEEQGNSSDAKANALNSEINALREEMNKEPESFLTGFASLGNVPPETGTGVLAIIIVIGIAILIVKFKDRLPFNNSIYGKVENEDMGFTKKDEDIAEKVMSESQDESQTGKWAFGDSKPPAKQKRKRFNVGDLLKKD